MNNRGTDIHKYTNEFIISSFVRSFVCLFVCLKMNMHVTKILNMPYLRPRVDNVTWKRYLA